MPIDLAGKDWLLPAALMLAAGLAAVVWAYHRAPADGRVRGICMGLKILGLILLLLCLLNPMITAERAKPGAHFYDFVFNCSFADLDTDSLFD